MAKKHTPPQYGIGGLLGTIGGGLLGGAATLLTAGAAAPLLPAFIGAGASLGRGIGNEIEDLTTDPVELKQQAIPLPRPQSSRTFGASATSRNIPTFQLGGALQPPGATQPLEEKSIDKMLVDLDGPIHEDGGIAIAGNEVEDKETMFRFKGEDGEIERFIFSNTLMVPDTKKSFAVASKEIEGRSDKRPDSDRIANKTKERDLKKLMVQQIPLTEKAEGLRLG
ncbi:unnamed protein product, partial [marine sediment metagenome]